MTESWYLSSSTSITGIKTEGDIYISEIPQDRPVPKPAVNRCKSCDKPLFAYSVRIIWGQNSKYDNIKGTK